MKVCLKDIDHMEVIFNLNNSKSMPGFVKIFVSWISRSTNIDSCVNKVSLGSQVKAPINAQFRGYGLRTRIRHSVHSIRDKMMNLVNLRSLCWLDRDKRVVVVRGSKFVVRGTNQKWLMGLCCYSCYRKRGDHDGRKEDKKGRGLE